MPTIERDQRVVDLEEKLASLYARSINQTEGPNGSLLNWYAVNGLVVIVQVFPNSQGYEIFSPVAAHSANVDATFKALERLANVKPAVLSVDQPFEPAIFGRMDEATAAARPTDFIVAYHSTHDDPNRLFFAITKNPDSLVTLDGYTIMRKPIAD